MVRLLQKNVATMSCEVNVDLYNSLEDDGVYFKLIKLSLLIFFYDGNREEMFGSIYIEHDLLKI